MRPIRHFDRYNCGPSLPDHSQRNYALDRPQLRNRILGAPYRRAIRRVRLPGNGLMGSADIVIGRVIMIHIRDDVITPDGRLNIPKIRPLARLGYYDYASVDSVFEMVIPGDNSLLLAGLEGAPVRK